MRHAFVDIGDKTMCSRCGNEVFRVDEQCPSIGDGKIYKQGNPPGDLPEYIDDVDEQFAKANPIVAGWLKQPTGNTE